MTEIVAGSERGFHIASVMRIDIHRIVCSACLGCFNEAFHNRIAVGTAAVLGADGNLLFRALQAFAHAAHIHGNGFCASFRDIAGSAVADLFKNGDVGIKRALRDNLFIPDVFCKPEENTERLYCTLDLFPTTLAAMGCKIEGDKLGLGTNLYSSKKTLYEEFGEDFVNSELSKNSEFVNSTISNWDPFDFNTITYQKILNASSFLSGSPHRHTVAPYARPHRRLQTKP